MENTSAVSSFCVVDWSAGRPDAASFSRFHVSSRNTSEKAYTNVSPNYHIQIQYRYLKMPRVWVLSPMLPSDAPHRYSDGSLCLYYPGDGSWTPALPIAQTFVPWTALWLAYYEIWLRTGRWYGLEVPHGQSKK